MTEPTIGVAGFGRCGSTMLMHALDLGGVPPVPGSQRGSYELPDHESMRYRSTMTPGHTVKVLDSILWYPLPHANWRFIWLDRDPVQQSRSQAKLLVGTTGLHIAADALVDSYSIDRSEALHKLAALGPVLTLSFEDALAHPYTFCANVHDFLEPDFELHIAAASASIHSRGPECLPDLSFELSVSAS